MVSDKPWRDPLERFEAEHAEALLALERLEAAAQALEAGQPGQAQLAEVREVERFLATAVREHNDNEERALFPHMGEGAPTGLFVEEHRALRSLERQLREALEAFDAVDQVPPLALAIVDLLRAHIERENEVLFPMAREMLGAESLEEVAKQLNG
jgi:hemerythrin-like domain-containing protein